VGTSPASLSTKPGEADEALRDIVSTMDRRDALIDAIAQIDREVTEVE
jgi:hypothetical protein